MLLFLYGDVLYGLELQKNVKTYHSRYKKILTDERHRLKPDNIHKIMITKCYYTRLDETEFAERKALELVRKQVKLSKEK